MGDRRMSDNGKKVRRVFGRLRVDAGGKQVRLELTREGLVATPLYSRVSWTLPLKMR